MNRQSVFFVVWAFISLISAPVVASDANVIEDDGIGMSYEELKYLVSQWPASLQESAANDVGDRLELLSMGLAMKKMAAEAEQVAELVDRDEYWKYNLAMQNLKRKLVFDHYVKNIQVPDMSELAQERYVTEKDKYALVPEMRSSSHILLMCPPGRCDRAERRPDAERVLAEVKAGGDFAELAKKYSEEPGASKRGGKFGTMLRKGMPNISPPYVGAVFELGKVGDVSDLVETQFGFHIIRLDEIEESFYKPYEEVKEQIVADLTAEYVKLSVKEFEAQYRISDQAHIDGKAMEEIFGPYQTELTQGVEEGSAPVEVEPAEDAATQAID